MSEQDRTTAETDVQTPENTTTTQPRLNHESGQNQGTLEEAQEKTDVSLGGITAYLVGAGSILLGVMGLFAGPIYGLTFIVAGVFGLPPTRRMLEDELGLHFSRWFSIMAYLGIIAFGSGLGAAV